MRRNACLLSEAWAYSWFCVQRYQNKWRLLKTVALTREIWNCTLKFMPENWWNQNIDCRISDGQPVYTVASYVQGLSYTDFCLYKDELPNYCCTNFNAPLPYTIFCHWRNYCYFPNKDDHDHKTRHTYPHPCTYTHMKWSMV